MKRRDRSNGTEPLFPYRPLFAGNVGASITDSNEPNSPEVGDLVILPFARVREQHGLPAEVGLALEDRRNVLRVYFSSLDRTFWLEAGHLQAVAADRLPVSADIGLIHRLAQHVHADLLEIYEQSDSTTTWFVFSVGGSLHEFATIAEVVGDRLHACHVEPASMRRVRIRLELTRDSSL